MTDEEETAYVRGSRSATLCILRSCLSELGYDSAEGTAARWVLEREATVSALRDACADYGDNDWSENLHLAAVVTDHLVKNLDWRRVAIVDKPVPAASVDNWPDEPPEDTLGSVPSPVNSDTCSRLSRLLRAARAFCYEPGDNEKTTSDLIGAVLDLHDVSVEGEYSIDDSFDGKLPADQDQIMALARARTLAENRYDRLKVLYDTRMWVTREALARATTRCPTCRQDTPVVTEGSQLARKLPEQQLSFNWHVA